MQPRLWKSYVKPRMFILVDNTSMDFIIGIDIGTSNTKAIAFSGNGAVLESSNVSYGALQPSSGYHEQDPLVFFKAVLGTLEEVISKTKGHQLKGISFSSAMHGLMAVDKDGTPLTNIITWADLRSRTYSEQLRQSEAGKRIYERTGTPIHPMAPLSKLIWMRHEDPVTFAATYKFISIKEYIFFRLFGEYLVDYSIASATGLFDIYTLDWNDEALLTAGIHKGQLSTPVTTTHSVKGLSEEFTESLGLNEDVPFIIGGSDGCLANLGSNAVDPGDTAITIGTSGAVRMISTKPQHDSKGRIFNYVLADNKYVSGGPINNGVIVLKWYSENFLQHTMTNEEGFSWYMSQVAEVEAGSDGLVFLPYVYGERAPVWDADAKAVFFGIHSRHGKAHFMRAVVEGICFALYQVTKSLEETIGEVSNMYASGGFIHSREWLQMLADIFGKDINVTNSNDASALGAAILGMKSVGMITDLSVAKKFISVTETFHPDEEKHRKYMLNYAIYASLYYKLKDEFSRQEILHSF